MLRNKRGLLGVRAFRSPLATTFPLHSLRTTTPVRAVTSTHQLSESFLDGTSSIYVEDMYKAWKANPSSVHVSWASYFKNMEQGVPPGQAYQSPPTLHGATRSLSAMPDVGLSQVGAAEHQRLRDSMRLMLLIRAYQVRGHLLARLDPLTNGSLNKGPEPQELQPTTYGFTEADMDRPIDLAGENLILGFLHSGSPHRTLREILARLKETYCGSIGIEYMHIPDRTECNWLRERIETPQQHSFTKEQKYHILDRLTWSSMFERFLGTKYSRVKRFGLDGCESLIPGMKAMIDLAADLGVENVVMGMPHRGRLNVLANVVRKPLAAILNEFHKDKDQLDDMGEGSGDVKYHLGTSYDRPTVSGKKVHISLLANPSHLEAVNPVVLGKARAKQDLSKDKDPKNTMPILLHGDAAFCGQGVVYETFDLGWWRNFTVGGTVHIIVNNQIGFTTDMKVSRTPTSSPYPTDVAKTANAPIFHVNGDDPEAVVHAMQLATEYRQAFNKDVVVDIICYRKFGHNEIDEPSFTQPLMYEKIRKQIPTLEKYRAKLVSEGVVTEEQVQKMTDTCMQEYNKAYLDSNTYTPSKMDWLSSYWKGFKSPKQISLIRKTGVPRDTLYKLGEKITSWPAGFQLHPTLEKIMERKKEMFKTGKGFDWATAEALAFGSLLLEGNIVRLTGQDVERGTFSHRHAVLHDINTDQTYVPLTNLGATAPCYIHNSPLSEFATLGFELGYSLETPNALVLWEAQFGDFSNGAQVITDQFISCGEQKWLRQSGLVMLLPHGYDGQGPEHSSARLERFLQMTDSDPTVIPPMDESQRTQIQETNWQIVNCTTPANYFHALRRQIHRDFRKPLIVMSPKRLLRYPRAISSIDEFADDSATSHGRFSRVIADNSPNLVAPKSVRRVVFCSGNVYYDLLQRREEAQSNDIALVRVEQLAPFPFDHIANQANLYPNAEIVWAQEEPMNMGAWYFIYHHMRTALQNIRGKNWEPRYVGRPASAAPATGSPKTHERQLRELLADAIN